MLQLFNTAPLVVMTPKWLLHNYNFATVNIRCAGYLIMWPPDGVSTHRLRTLQYKASNAQKVHHLLSSHGVISSVALQMSDHEDDTASHSLVSLEEACETPCPAPLSCCLHTSRYSTQEEEERMLEEPKCSVRSISEIQTVFLRRQNFQS